MILYGRGQSRSFRCLWALNEVGIEFEYVHLDRDKLPENYPGLNSQLKVPTLVDGDLILTESAAIVNYADNLTGKGFIPTSPAARARYDDICYFVMTDLEQPLWSLGKHRLLLPEDQRIPAMVETASWEFQKSQRALQHLMKGKSFAVGDSFTFADLLLAHTINWAERFQMQVAPEFIAYRDSLYQREACQKSLATVEETG